MRILRAIAWYVTSLMGDRDYDRYLAHHRRAHPGTPALTKRQYWRERGAAQPGARCC